MSAIILQGDCRETLKTLEAGSVQTCVTSPPYWGLRDYGTARWEGGNDPACEHRSQLGGYGEKSWKQLTNKGTQGYQYAHSCPKCGAVRVDNQLGAEATPEEYVANMVAVFREVWRVLADDGTLWLNLGDSYAGSGGMGGWNKDRNGAKDNANRKVSGLKPKDLVGIPWMVAFALRADGWYLRSEVIWHKPNPMPESAKDRPTKSHEQIFLLSKSPRYYYDAEAIAEKTVSSEYDKTKRAARRLSGTRYLTEGRGGHDIGENLGTARETRNKRDVWTVTTKAYKGAHFATFPPDLILPCILAGSRPGDVVLDPFSGSGTTGAVAIRHNRSYVGCELKPDYIELTNDRLGLVQPILYGGL